MPLLGAWDVYAVGLAGIEPRFVGTPYAGCYGCPLDTGISPPGNMARAARPRPQSRQPPTPRLCTGAQPAL